MSKIEALLYNSMGLNTASIGSSAVLSSVQQRMSECFLTDIEHYTEKLLTDKDELQQLIEEVVVAETWFFRDKQPFTMLTRFIKEEWLVNNPGKVIRVLSLPCATGEEPYSIAITLIEAGLMPSQLKIDAFDISERNIKHCKTAYYRENSFRGVSFYIRDRFFNFEDNNYYPDILIKTMVNFEVASILDPIFINTQLPYDVVFCRNLLIYFDRDTQAIAVTMLNKILNPKGLLFVGHAETNIFTNNWTVSKRYPKSFIVRKVNDNAKFGSDIVAGKGTIAREKVRNKLKSKMPSVLSNNTQRKTKLFNKPDNLNRSTKKVKTVLTAVKVKGSSTESDLAMAKKLADSGSLIEAEKICVTYMENHKHDKEVYYLLAIIQLAIGDELKSLQYFKNVIYLAPDHYDSLMYLATLLAGQGDDIAASRYRDRAGRVKARMNF